MNWNSYKLMFRKNIKILINNKISFIILFVGPILLLFLMSLMYYNQNTYNFELGIVGSSDNPTYLTIEKEIINNGFLVTKFPSSSKCESSLQKGDNKLCLLFPQNFEGTNSTIILIVDNSNSYVKEILENIITTTLNGGKNARAQESVGELIEIITLLELELEEISFSIENNQNITINTISELNTIKKRLIQADAMFDPEDLNLETLEGRAIGVKEIKESFINDSILLIESTLNLTQNLSSQVQNSNISSSDKASFEAKLDTIESDINEILRESKSYRSSTYFIEKLTSELDELIIEINSSKNDLDNSFSLQEDSIDNNINNLNIVKNNLDKSSQEINKSLTQSYSFSNRNSSTLVNPFQLKIENAFKSQNNSLAASFPFIFSSLILILSLFLGAIISFKEENSLSKIRTILATPSSFRIILTQLSSVVSLLYIQLSIIVLLFYVFFIKGFYLDLVLIFPLLLIFLSIFVLLGILIGHLVKSQISLFVSLLGISFMFFLFSGKLLPLELLSSNFVTLIQYINPYFVMESILRKIVLFSAHINELVIELGILFIIFLILLIITIAINSNSNKGKIFKLLHRSKLKKNNNVEIKSSLEKK